MENDHPDLVQHTFDNRCGTIGNMLPHVFTQEGIGMLTSGLIIAAYFLSI